MKSLGHIPSTEFKQVAQQLVKKFQLNPNCASKIIAVLEANSYPQSPSGCGYDHSYPNNGLSMC
jgi:hypothetical protein